MYLTESTYKYVTGEERDRLSDYLPYDAYDLEKGCFVSLQKEDPHFGFIWRCIPFYWVGEEQFSTIVQVLDVPCPEKSTLQVILTATPDIGDICNDFLGMRIPSRNEPLLGELLVDDGKIDRVELHKIIEEQKISGVKLGQLLVDKGILKPTELKGYIEKQRGITRIWARQYVSYLKKHTDEGFYPDVPVPTRGFNLFFTLKVPIDLYDDIESQYNAIQPAVVAIESNMKTAYFWPKRLDPTAFRKYFWFIFNPDTDMPEIDIAADVPIREQMVGFNTLLEWKPSFKHCHMKLNSREVSVNTFIEFPKKVFIHNTNEIIGTMMRENLRQICCPFMVTLNVINTSTKGFIYNWAERMLAQKPQGSWAYKVKAKQKEAEQSLYKMDEERESFKYFSLHFILFSQEGYRHRDIETARSIWAKQGFEALNESVFPVMPYLMSIPLGMKYNEGTKQYLRKRSRVAPVQSIAHVAPVQADPAPQVMPVMLFVTRRGQVAGFDLFTASDTNYNAVVFAESGAGKSFLMNYMVLCYYSVGAKIWIIDIGYSYKRLCRYLGGVYIDFKDADDLCLNPFTFIQDINEAIETLADVIGVMARPRGGLDDEEMNLIREACLAAWDKYENEATITRVQDYLARRGDPKGAVLAKLLSDYTTGGIYAHLFDGPATIDLNNSFLTVMELESLSNTPNLRNVMLLLIMNQIQEAAYLGDRRVPKLVLIDEAWQFFKGDSIGTARFIEHGFRRIRKYRGAFVVITQGLDDYTDESNVIGKAILNSSAHQFILKQKPEAITRAIETKTLEIEKGLGEYMKSIHTVRGKYSEVAIRTGGSTWGIMRLFVDPMSYAMFNTDAEKVAFLDEMAARGMSFEDAVTEALRTGYGTGKPITEGLPEHIKSLDHVIDYLKSLPPEIMTRMQKIIFREGGILERVSQKG